MSTDDDELRQQRLALVEQKKREIDEVYDSHDSALRELFHLHKFITLIGFDPHVAKQEKSEVWETFRKPYDLWDKQTSGPSSRRTRRATTERKESLISSSIQTAAPTPVKKAKPPDIERALRRASMPNPLGQSRSLDSPAETKGKGKGKSFAHPVTPARPLVSSRKRPFPEDLVDESESSTRVERNGGHGHSALGLSDMDADDGLVDSVAALSVTPSKPTLKKQKRKQKQKRHQSPPSPTHSSTNPSPTHTPLPKRIRLIVKPPPPPPIATHPAQLPRSRAYGGSLSRLLNSFALLEEGDDDDSSPSVGERADSGPGQLIRNPGTVEDAGPVKIRIGMTWEEFEQSVKDEVDVWRRIREMRRRGGLRCMRGWEIFRGEEDEVEDEEEGEGSVEADAEGMEEEVKENQVEGAKEGQAGGESKEEGQVSREGELDLAPLTTDQTPVPAASDALPETTVPTEMDLDTTPTAADSDPSTVLEPLSKFFDAPDPGPVFKSTPDVTLNGTEVNTVPRAVDGTDLVVPTDVKPDSASGALEHVGSEPVRESGSALVQVGSVPATYAEGAPGTNGQPDSMQEVEPGSSTSSGILVSDSSEPMLVGSHEPAIAMEKKRMDVDPAAEEIASTSLAASPAPDLTPTIQTSPPTTQPQVQSISLKTPTPEPVSTVPLPLPSHPALPPSHHETLLASIPQHARRVKEAPLTLRHRPATLISRYWERRQGAADRLAAAEERRIRAGAKALAKNVVAKAWKDAVAVIRARLKEQEEAEQAREGRKHLAAILEQSSALLETQQEDLGLGRRPGGRSRSASSGASMRSRRSSFKEDRDQEEEEGDGSEEEEEGSEGSGATDVDDGGEEVEAGSEMLLDMGSRGESEVGDEEVDADGEESEEDEEMEGDGKMEEAKPDGDAMSVTEDGPGVGASEAQDYVPFSQFLDTSITDEPNPGSAAEEDAISVNGADTMSIVDTQTAAVPIIAEDLLPVSQTNANGTQSRHSPVNGEIGLEATDPAPSRPATPSDAGNSFVDVVGLSSPVAAPLNGFSSPSPIDLAEPRETNGQSDVATSPLRATSTLATPDPATPAAPADAPSTAPTSPVVRKLTLKFKALEPPTNDSTVSRRRSSRRTSVSTPATGGGDSDSEVDGLAKDAELPIEELMRRYGYVGTAEAGQNQGSTPTEDTRDDATTTRAADSDDEEDEGDDEDNKAAGALLGLKDVSSMNEGGVRPPFLLRGTLRPYQQAGMEWLVSGYVRGINGILADEMGLGKTIQTISLLAHLACDQGIWGPHLIIVPTSVILNWEMEFKKFLPGFKVLSYYGSIKERKERRVGWNTEHAFNVVVTSYQLVIADQAIFRRKKWHYMILDEAHNIKNFKSQRWATLFSFNSERRLLLTGTPLQNNITELWSLLYFVQPDTANKQQFEEWFLETMRHAVETGDVMDEQTRDTVDKLHTVLRPYILRRLKADVERELPSKHEHIVYCRLSKRQRYLYDEFMSRSQTKETLAGGNFLSIVNCLMQLRKVCNHPDLFEVRPIVTSFAIPTGRSAVVDFEIKELLVRKRLLRQFDDDAFSVQNHSFDIMFNATDSIVAAERRAALNASQLFPFPDVPGEPPPKDLRTIAGNKRWLDYQRQLETHQRQKQLQYVNTSRNTRIPILGAEKLAIIRSFTSPLVSTDLLEQQRPSTDMNFTAARLVKSYVQREEAIGNVIDRFVFATPLVVALDVPRLTLAPIISREPNGTGGTRLDPILEAAFAGPQSDVLHRASVKLQIAFPESSLLQYDCGKLQALDTLLRERRAGGHRVLIFTQMTRVLDILEIFLNLHGYRYLRLDGSTKIEQRQVVTERFNVDSRIFAFIASSRSGGVGINLTGADTVIFYDSDYNPSMDRQCEDRAHRIGQTRTVHIYRFISQHTVEESMLRKANQKRLLDELVIEQGEFDWRQVRTGEFDWRQVRAGELDFSKDKEQEGDAGGGEAEFDWQGALAGADDARIESALAAVEETVDVDAARMATREERTIDVGDFGATAGPDVPATDLGTAVGEGEGEGGEEDGDDGLSPVERYMLRFVESDWEFFS